MRVTFRELNRQTQTTLNRRYSDLGHLEEMLSTGKRLMKPSDSPVDVANDLKLISKQQQISQFKSNINDGMSFMTVSDTAMLSMNTLMQRMRELAIQGSNDVLSSNERLYIQKEQEQLLRQFVSLGNSTYKGDYIFGGTQTKIPPLPLVTSQSGNALNYSSKEMAFFDGSGGVGVAAQLRQADTLDPITRIIPGSFQLKIGNTAYVEGRDYTVNYVSGTITPINAALAVDVSEGGTFAAGPLGRYTLAGFQVSFDYISQGRDIYGDKVVASGDVFREIEDTIITPINITADELMRDSTNGQHLLDVAIGLGSDLLHNNRAGIESSIGTIDSSFKVLLSAQSKNGARINRFETTLDRNESQYTETSRLQSDLEDAEYADTIGKFSLAQTAYQAALKAAATIIQPSLVNYL